MRQRTVAAFTNLSKSKVSKDFFGINHVTSKDIAGAYINENKLPYNLIEKKYEPLMTKRNRLANEESEDDVIFGKVRSDEQNAPRYHGQYEPGSSRKLYDTIEVKQRYVPDSGDQHVESSNEQSYGPQTIEGSFIGNPAYKLSEVKSSHDLTEILDLLKSERKLSDIIAEYSNAPPLKFNFDSEISSTNVLTPKKGDVESTKKDPSNEEQDGPNSRNFKQDGVKSNLDNKSSRDDNRDAYLTQADMGKIIRTMDITPNDEEVPLEDLNPLTNEFEQGLNRSFETDRFSKALDEKYDIDKNDNLKKTPRKAIEHIAKVKSGEEEPTTRIMKDKLARNTRLNPLEPQLKLDSKGKRDYSLLVPDWYKARKVDILEYLKQSIIYHNYDIIAINKPYGLASHDEDRKRETYDVNSLMRELVKSLYNYNQIHLVHRLDKTTTGVLLFATSQERARMLHKQFKSDEIKKTYLAIVKGLPDPEEGIIDIPIGEMHSGGKVIMCPVPERLPEFKQIAKRYTEARRAITNYRTLSSCSGLLSLVEVKTESGVKHQIRCHLGFCLGTPILGDHKYTQIGKLVPQKLPPTALKAFNIRQAKVRTLPIHLHAKAVMIPGAKLNGESLFINAPLPHHFENSMKLLQLRS